MSDNIEKRWEELQERKNTILQNKAKVEAVLDSHKKALKEAIQECKDAGFNPDTLPEDIKKAEEVYSVKLDNYKADLDAAEKLLAPMVEAIS
jgi:hypothetical protein